jgi:hypothetical protein
VRKAGGCLELSRVAQPPGSVYSPPARGAVEADAAPGDSQYIHSLLRKDPMYYAVLIAVLIGLIVVYFVVKKKGNQ